jgi:hypothetical protein
MTTNYVNTFIEVAEDCPAASGTIPNRSDTKPTVAALQFAMIAPYPYKYTSDDVLFTVYADREGIEPADRKKARKTFFAKPQACLRTSPLARRYGWGIHHDAEGRVALVAIDSEEYREFAGNPDIQHVKAMRSKRAA